MPDETRDMGFLLQPPGPNEILIAFGEEAQITPKVKKSLDKVVNDLFTSQEFLAGGTSCHPLCSGTYCGHYHAPGKKAPEGTFARIVFESKSTE